MDINIKIFIINKYSKFSVIINIEIFYYKYKNILPKTPYALKLALSPFCQLKRDPTKINWIIANNSHVSETRSVIVIFK